MRVFVVCTGRCGSMTLSKALGHATNYTCAHESRSGRITDRLAYPDQHIEVDNRLSFMLGLLHKRYPEAFYIWLRRSRNKVVDSYTKRFNTRAGIMRAYANGIVQNTRVPNDITQRRRVAELYVDATEANIARFLHGIDDGQRYRFLDMDEPTLATDFADLWQAIKAEGDLTAAQHELAKYYNASK